MHSNKGLGFIRFWKCLNDLSHHYLAVSLRLKKENGQNSEEMSQKTPSGNCSDVKSPVKEADVCILGLKNSPSPKSPS